jgi:hypothetical protein
MLKTLSGLSAIALLLASPALAQDASLAITVKPVRAGQAEVQYVEFSEQIRLTSSGKDAGKPLDLRSPITYAGRTGIADRVKDLAVRDAQGRVPIKVEDDPADHGGFPFYRHWRAERPVSGAVSVSYKMMSFTGVATVGPQFDFYSHAGGVSTGGMAFFVLPQNMAKDTDLSVHWDLSDLAKGSIAASAFGAGDFKLKGAPEQLAQAYYMAGPLGHYTPAKGSDFNLYWLGKPSFEPNKEATWVGQGYEVMRKFWKDPEAGKYTAFIRVLPGTGGGTGLYRSFMVGVAPGDADPAKQGPRGTLFHEIDHMFVGQISGGVGQAGTTWFGEGLNVHYTRMLQLRSGLAPVSDFASDVNASARGYYTNPYRNTSADELSKLGFSGGIGGASPQNVAYTRGSLYFADMDAKIHKASGGKRGLDDVILPLFEQRRKAAGKLSQDELIAAFVREIGPQARDEFESVIVRGETINPAPDAFGPCLDRKPKTYEAAGKPVEGFEWVRKAGVADAVCRAW